jgi:hypothetical protein
VVDIASSGCLALQAPDGSETLILRSLGYTRSGFDGYDLYFVADEVTVTLGFHQKYHIDAKDEEHIERFIQRLKRIEAK